MMHVVDCSPYELNESHVEVVVDQTVTMSAAVHFARDARVDVCDQLWMILDRGPDTKFVVRESESVRRLMHQQVALYRHSNMRTRRMVVVRNAIVP